MQWLIFTPKRTPRIEYAWKVLFTYVLQADFSLTDDVDFYRNSNACKINYSTKRQFSAEVLIAPGNLLVESGIRPQPITIFEWEGLPAFFKTEIPDSDLPFDLPALIFYLVSRYEEYLPFEPDAHGRFSAAQSLAARASFLTQPLVNELIIRFKILLQQKFPTSDFRLPTSDFTFRPTYDIDMAWSYLHKGWLRSIGGSCRDLLKGDFRMLRQRWRVQMGKESDPFYTFDYLDTLHQHYNVIPGYFLLLGDYHPFDTNIPSQNTVFQQLIKSLHTKYPLGIHPSYASNENTLQLQKEIRRLQTLTGEAVTRSRQHFLKLKFPNTYQNLLAAGITEDYSLGYSDALGFRASIATPYPWYDLENEIITNLILHPFQVMDVTLKLYLQLNPAQAIENVTLIINKTRAVGGTFCTLWHNSSFSNVDNWTDWKEVYERILKLCV